MVVPLLAIASTWFTIRLIDTVVDHWIRETEED